LSFFACLFIVLYHDILYAKLLVSLTRVKARYKFWNFSDKLCYAKICI